jgi:signal transduction histidine kinase
MALSVLVDTLLVLANVHLARHPDNVLQTATVAQMIGVLLALYFLVASHGENLLQLAALNTSLDQRVQEAEAEFADRYAMFTHDALDAAALRERKTIYQSIHEDLSDKLLQLIYSASNPATADLARAALAELRDSRKLHPEQAHALEDVLADAFAEAQTRCEQTGLVLDWQVQGALQNWTLTARQESALLRTLREALSNLLKHAQAQRVTVTAMVSMADTPPTLIYVVADDGRGIAPTHRPGRGLVNMRNRMQELGGTVTIGPGESGGTRLHFTLPLRHGEELQQ